MKYTVYIWLKTVRIRKGDYTLQSNISNEAYILAPYRSRHKYKDSSLTKIDSTSIAELPKYWSWNCDSSKLLLLKYVLWVFPSKFSLVAPMGNLEHFSQSKMAAVALYFKAQESHLWRQFLNWKIFKNLFVHLPPPP